MCDMRRWRRKVYGLCCLRNKRNGWINLSKRSSPFLISASLSQRRSACLKAENTQNTRSHPILIKDLLQLSPRINTCTDTHTRAAMHTHCNAHRQKRHALKEHPGLCHISHGVVGLTGQGLHGGTNFHHRVRQWAQTHPPALASAGTPCLRPDRELHFLMVRK